VTNTTHLFLVRHGETDFNLQGIVQGRGVNTSLNDTGTTQAQALAARFADQHFDAIYSSPLTRAFQTASSVAQGRETLQIKTDPDLEEMSWGVFEGKPHNDHLAVTFEEMKQRWHNGDHDFGVEGGESLRQVQTRGLNAIERIVAAEAGKHVLVVAHGRFLRILLASLLKDYGVKRMEELEHANTGVNYLTHQDGQCLAQYLNCTQH